MKQRVAIVAALVFAAIVVAAFYQSANYSDRTGEDTPLYSVRRHDPYGTAALRDLLVERGIPVRTLERPGLEPSDHGVLIQVLADSRSDPDELHPRTTQLTDWMFSGNTVVQLTRLPTDLMQAVKLEPTTRPASKLDDLRKFELAGGAPEDAPVSNQLARTTDPHAPPLMLWLPMVFDDTQPHTWKPLARLSTDRHSVAAIEIQIGKGRLVVVGSPTVALNGTIGTEGNLDFLLKLIGTQPVIIDEWSHGIGRQTTIIGFLHDVGLLPVLIQVLLVAGLFVWSTSGYGAPPPSGQSRQRSSVEQIETLGYLYSQSLGTAVALERVHQEAQRRLCDALHCQPKDLAARLNTLRPELRQKCDQMFARLDELSAEQGLPCQACGYNLSFNESGRCPECGSVLDVKTRNKIVEARERAKLYRRPANMPQSDRAKQRRLNRINQALADVLSASYRLALEITRDRRSAPR